VQIVVNPLTSDPDQVRRLLNHLLTLIGDKPYYLQNAIVMTPLGIISTVVCLVNLAKVPKEHPLYHMGNVMIHGDAEFVLFWLGFDSEAGWRREIDKFKAAGLVEQADASRPDVTIL